MDNDKPGFPPQRTAWDGYLATFQTTLTWLMQNTTPAVEEKACSHQREHFATAAGGGLPPSMPAIGIGRRLVQQAFDLADFAALEYYIRSQRRVATRLPTVATLLHHLSENALPQDHRAIELIALLTEHAQALGDAQDQPFNDDVHALVLALDHLRQLPAPQAAKWLRDHGAADSNRYPHLATLSWAQGNDDSYLSRDLRDALNCIEQVTTHYR